MSDRHRQVDRRLRQSHTPRRLQNHMHNCKKDDIHRTSSSLWPVGIAYKRKTIYTERLQAFGPWGSHTKERRYTPNVFKPLARGDRIQKKDDIHRTSSSLWPVGIAYKRI
ncbi:uncharacterized protein LOC115331324 isoform X2 [Ixodes scapularis]|uniref:uncharacterized protein LOC115331324 isoform X2 n=1 Tax=Ixodes scapularis TaxID=6945 RepID=UPI001C3959C9|nr:uncharacterized protein LOC115331324 isoform X2 [Ixodes scapularis]